jgi:hypothetical protein
MNAQSCFAFVPLRVNLLGWNAGCRLPGSCCPRLPWWASAGREFEEAAAQGQGDGVWKVSVDIAI